MAPGRQPDPSERFLFLAVIPYGGSDYYNAGYIVDGELMRDPRYLTDVITDHALQFLERRRGDPAPFYLSVHYTAPHSPGTAISTRLNSPGFTAIVHFSPAG